MNIELHPLLSISTLVDPRYKRMNFQSPEAVSKLLTRVKNLIRFSSEATTGQCISVEPVVQQADDDLWSHHKQLQRTYNNNNNYNGVTEIGGLPLELQLYLKEDSYPKDVNPLSLWNDSLKFKYTTLSKIAEKFLPLLGTSVPAERLFSKAGNLITEKRNRLHCEKIQKLLFLGSLSASKFHKRL